MPKRVEALLRRRAEQLKREGKLHGDVDAYVYGTMQRIKSRTVRKGDPPPGDYRGKVENADGTVTYT